MSKIMAVLLVGVGFLTGCPTAPPPVAEVPTEDAVELERSEGPDRILIQLKAQGLSPNGDGFFDTLDITLFHPRNAEVSDWELLIIQNRDTVKTFRGRGQLPGMVTWEGLNERGAVAPEGRYYAEIRAQRAGERSLSRTRAFVLDLSGPVGALVVTPQLFSPDGDGVNDVLSLDVRATDGLTDLESWTIEVVTAQDEIFHRFFSTQYPLNNFTWDGKNVRGNLIHGASDYDLKLQLRDNLGNISRATTKLSTDIMVFRDGVRLRIQLNSVTFKPYTADFNDVTPVERQRNLESLRLLASKLQRFPQHKIHLEGHAVVVFWDDPVLAAQEESEVLLPLSISRAEVIKAELAARGIEAERMTTSGMGGTRPLVPHSDLANRWQNRRVEFYLER